MSTQSAKKATIYDIAREAGVSPATVSRVINHHAHVSSATKEKIISVMEKLHFSRPLTQKEKSKMNSEPGTSSCLLRHNSPLYFDYFDNTSEPVHSHIDIELIYVLDGHLTVSISDRAYDIQKNDFVIVNSGEMHGHQSSPNVLYAKIYIKYFPLCDMIKKDAVHLENHPGEENSAACEDVRLLIKKILNPEVSYDDENALQREALYYSFLSQLITRFPASSSDRSAEHDHHIAEIKYYIDSNYKEPLTLNDLAKALYLSPSYTSTYFKKHFGVTFSDYLTVVRLEHAVEDLKHHEKSITRGAMDNGFPNVNAFNKAFREKYHTSPSEYFEKPPHTRQTSPAQPPQNTQTTSDYTLHNAQIPPDNPSCSTAANGCLPLSDNLTIKQRALQVLGTDAQLTEISTDITADALNKREYDKFWNKIINIGRSNALFDAETREHLLMAQKELGFEYVRFWELCEPVTFLSYEEKPVQYNFTKLDRLFDFLIYNHLKPFIELGFKPLVLLNMEEGSHHFMVSEQKDIIFKTAHEYERFLYAFARHYSERYGTETIEQWYFEQWLDPRMINGADFTKYFEYYNAAMRALKSVSPLIRLGGGGISVTDSDYAAFLHAGRQNHWEPDFFSIYCYPYTDILRGSTFLNVSDQIHIFKNAVSQAGYKNTDTYITEWNFTVSDRSLLNDGNFKSAYITRNIFECFDEIPMMGYWYLSDILSEYVDTRFILNGGNGLITKDGLKKPAYYAFHFMNHLGKYMLYHDKNSVITLSEQGSFAIVCHNFKRPDTAHILHLANEKNSIHTNTVNDPDAAVYYDNDRDKHIRIQIKNVRNGSYTVKMHVLNSHNGSIWNEWKEMGFPEKLSRFDIDYLKHICTPRIRITTQKVTDNTLQIETTLTAQEVQFIHLRIQ